MAKPSRKKQDEFIRIEVEKWNQVLAEIPDDRRAAAADLVNRVAFMTVTLEILEEDIKVKGPTYKFKNGVQEMYVENPSQKSYNTMINRYTSAYDKLLDLLPKPDANKPPKREPGGLV